jgi:hypothetical protein
VPWPIANASYKRQQDNDGVTEIVEIMHHGHALTIDNGWRDVTDTALASAPLTVPEDRVVDWVTGTRFLATWVSGPSGAAISCGPLSGIQLADLG